MSAVSPAPATGPAPLEPAVLPGRTMAVVDRSIGLPGGWAGPPLDTVGWAAVVEEQRFLGSHADRIDTLSRLAYLGRVLAQGLPDEIRDDPAVREAYLGG